ncbi:hypothetical protein BJX96DRAFT_59512 [Aspergillus floccosus]
MNPTRDSQVKGHQDRSWNQTPLDLKSDPFEDRPPWGSFVTFSPCYVFVSSFAGIPTWFLCTDIHTSSRTPLWRELNAAPRICATRFPDHPKVHRAGTWSMGQHLDSGWVEVELYHVQTEIARSAFSAGMPSAMSMRPGRLAFSYAEHPISSDVCRPEMRLLNPLCK